LQIGYIDKNLEGKWPLHENLLYFIGSGTEECWRKKYIFAN